MQREDKQKLEFSTLRGQGVRVAIIDSGVDSTHPKIGPVSGGIEFRINRNDELVSAPCFKDHHGHGTGCAGIIRKKAPQAEIYSVRIFDETLSTDGRLLMAALEWSIAQVMDVVNLSLGMIGGNFRSALVDVSQRADDAGTIMVAAEHNEGLQSYPAALPSVIGVKAGKVRGLYGYFYQLDSAVECVARGDEQRLCWLQPREIMTGGTSFAAPHITGIVTLVREACPGAKLDQVRKFLQANSLKEEPKIIRGTNHFSYTIVARKSDEEPRSCAGDEQTNPYAWIRKASLYPYNKEMHGFVRYIDQLSFNVVGVGDPAGKGLVGKDAGEAIGLPSVGIRIAPRLTEALDGADTLILGYVDELGRISERDVLRESIQTAIDKGANVFSFLSVPSADYDDLHALAHSKGLRIEYPHISLAHVQDLLEDPPPPSATDTPIVGVFGTSSQQGKFTLQLALRKQLLDRGYKVGQVGTEHQAELFGIDFAFPMGYAPALELPLEMYTSYLDLKVKEICHFQGPDIVIVGSQSGTIPYDVDEHTTHTMPAIAFLLGTKPDACILVVNSIDPDEYIEDTMNAIRALVKSPTILLAMSDKEKHIRTAYSRAWVTPRQMPNEEIRTKLGHLEDRFGVPAVNIVSEQGQEKLVDTVVKHFAAE